MIHLFYYAILAMWLIHFHMIHLFQYVILDMWFNHFQMWFLTCDSFILRCESVSFSYFHTHDSFLVKWFLHTILLLSDVILYMWFIYSQIQLFTHNSFIASYRTRNVVMVSTLSSEQNYTIPHVVSVGSILHKASLFRKECCITTHEHTFIPFLCVYLLWFSFFDTVNSSLKATALALLSLSLF